MNSRNTHHLLIPYSWGTSDIGGIGITPGLLSLIKEAAPNLPTTVFTLQRKGSAGFDFLRGYLPGFLPQCKVFPNPFPSTSISRMADQSAQLEASGEVDAPHGSALSACIDRWGHTKLTQFESGSLSAEMASQVVAYLLDTFPLNVMAEIDNETPDAGEVFRNAGFVLFNSGTMLNFGRMGKRQFWDFTVRFALPLMMARVLGIPYGINAQSFDAVDWPADLLYRQLFKDARFLFCRDTDSLRYLEQRDLLNASSGFRPDSTFYFDGSDDPWADEFMKKHGLEENSFMAVICRHAENRGVLAGTIVPERERQHAGKMKQFVEQWIERTNLPVLICPENKDEVQRSHDKLYSILSPSAKQMTICMDSFWTPEQASSIYRQARLVTGHMHTIIFSLAVGTPVLHIQYAEAGRKAWMVRDLGFGDWLFDIDESSSEELLNAALRIHEDHAAAEERVQAVLPRIKRLGIEVIEEIRSNWR